MKILEQFIKAKALDDFLHLITVNCHGKMCTDCLYGGELYVSPDREVHCPVRHILAEKLGIPIKEIIVPSAWPFPVEGPERLPPPLKDLRIMSLRNPEIVRQFVTWIK